MEDLCEKSDWAELKRPSKRMLEEERSTTDSHEPGDNKDAL